uniref:Putative triabin n=1 Tax=Panstrongylus lignarius TaxID=156445 RepID=A0A224XU73_9HEMI
MKMIIAVIFLGILMHAFAKDCQLQAAVTNFDSKQYFKMSPVYVTHSKYGPEKTVCQEYKTIKKGDTPKTRITAGLKYPGLHIPDVECTNKPKNGKPGQFDVECEAKGRNDLKMLLETSVIDTDYKKYAILQSCSKTGNAAEDIVVLQTSKDQVDQNIKAVFEKLKWSLDGWYSRAKVTCDNKKK